MARYRVLRGVHGEGGQPPVTNEKGEVVKPGRPLRSYYRGSPDGDVIETDADLLRHNRPGRQPKYARLPDLPPNFDSMTIEQLRDLAETQGLELVPRARKDEILQAIRHGGGPAIARPQPARR